MKRFFFLTGLLLIAFSGFSQNVQWASRVLGKSSEYSDRQYSAKQVLGRPNVLPVFRDSPCAWSPFKEQNRTDEYIHVGYKKAMRVRQVAVAESYNPGSVSRIYLYDTRGGEHLVYKNDSPTMLPDNGRMLRVKFAPTPYQVASVKVVLNTIGLPGWTHSPSWA